MMTTRLAERTGFLLGVFSANLSSGLAATTVPERWQATWEDNLRLAGVADRAGLDFILPVARYRGYGGETNFQGSSLDPTTLAAALLARTEQITVFSTVHTAFIPPVLAAKQLATADRIGSGRMGLNIVAGWNKPEYDMFGIDLPQGHDERYAMAQEWWDVVRRVWSEPEPFDYDGTFYQLKGVQGAPGPEFGALPVLNAGSSTQGRDFGARNADLVFTVLNGPEDGAEVVRAVRERARSRYGREAGTLTTAHVVCRPTRREAEEYVRHYAETNADQAAVDTLLSLQGAHAKTFTPEQLATFRTRFTAGHGSCPLIGSPDDVAAEIERYAATGLRGLTLSFVNFTEELQYFVEEVLPRLEKRGVRPAAAVHR
ncbi:LLM class flavin-dependent oxidoreductase [Streptomyces sp. NPDC091972]|uniref:LLM class flavin-dependent oxidoreductase n=1 Tax=Streptomyces sp. NPDC091972 TaxID=3366007 RepID=UPI00381ADCAE